MMVGAIGCLLFNKYYTYDNFCVPRIKYIMHDVEYESVLYNKAAHSVICFM